MARFVSLWFRHLTTDRFILRRPEFAGSPLILSTRIGNRMVVAAANIAAEAQGVSQGMAVADARAMVPELEVADAVPGQELRLLTRLGEWCIRYTPYIAVCQPDGLMMDVSGCAHLWGGERQYLKEIVTRLRKKGYDVRGAMADTAGAAWAVSRFGRDQPIIRPGEHAEALLKLPPAALRLDATILERLKKLGFYSIQRFIGMPRSALRRRFSTDLLLRLDQALGTEAEPLSYLQLMEPYAEQLPCMEPICTSTAIETAIRLLLEKLCRRLATEGKGIRTALLKCYRVDGKIIPVSIGTNRATHQVAHLFKLFELHISTIEPDWGIELFTLEAPKVEDVDAEQEVLWADGGCVLNDTALAELLDRLANKIGATSIRRYLPQEHYWPERSIRAARSLAEKPPTAWRNDRLRPSLLLPSPERIEVTALIPDYPPMLFVYRGTVHHVKRADGPERIEREWWLEQGEHRDYYRVEDEGGRRYWLFRSGHYSPGDTGAWFIHGFFA